MISGWHICDGLNIEIIGVAANAESIWRVVTSWSYIHIRYTNNAYSGPTDFIFTNIIIAKENIRRVVIAWINININGSNTTRNTWQILNTEREAVTAVVIRAGLVGHSVCATIKWHIGSLNPYTSII